MLAARIDLSGATVVDLFAGSGAMGIEALSRGAARAVFVERSTPAAAVIEENLALFGWKPGEVVADPLGAWEAEVCRVDALRWLLGGLPGCEAAEATVAFCDPPYRFTGWPAVFSALRARFVLAESPSELEAGIGWEVLRVRRHGGAVLSLVRRAEGQG